MRQLRRVRLQGGLDLQPEDRISGRERPFVNAAQLGEQVGKSRRLRGAGPVIPAEMGAAVLPDMSINGDLAIWLPQSRISPRQRGVALPS